VIPPEVDHAEHGIFDESHHSFRDQVRRFYAKEVEPQVAAWEKADNFDRGILRLGVIGRLAGKIAFISVRVRSDRIASIAGPLDGSGRLD
jgi:hypothetical protein